jgi:hypothetical protein
VKFAEYLSELNFFIENAVQNLEKKHIFVQNTILHISYGFRITAVPRSFGLREGRVGPEYPGI